jgi:hypothetical protein
MVTGWLTGYPGISHRIEKKAIEIYNRIFLTEVSEGTISMWSSYDSHLCCCGKIDIQAYRRRHKQQQFGMHLGFVLST